MLSPAGRGEQRDCVPLHPGYAARAEADNNNPANHPRGGNTMKRLMILNGPNLNLLGVREPHIYGTTTLAQIRENCERHAGELGLTLVFHQSNHEGQLVDWIQSARETADAIIINPAGYSFTSVAILDALKAFEGPILEVHISNIHARDEHHRHSKLSHAATGVICGLGPHGYIAAMHAVVEMAKK
jgi:3-dehydroquinate dehydratase II